MRLGEVPKKAISEGVKQNPLSAKQRVLDVISDVGISSRAYFYKEFTRKFGVTPKVYREKLLGNDTHKNQE